MINPKNCNGIWFYGLSGSGKTYASKFLHNKIAKSILIDGDEVRECISKDLGYSKKDREIQIQRVFGIAKIVMKSNFFPIISTVYFNKSINKKCKKLNIISLKIIRKNFNKIIESHKTYKNKKNVVGKDIQYEKFLCKKIKNDNTHKFLNQVSDFLQK